MSGPGRGHWDRKRSATERGAARRLALLAATRRAIADHGADANVGHVVALAGVGRNTFYAHFPDLRAARDAAEDEESERFRAVLAAEWAEARTPRERLRAVARAWVLTSNGSAEHPPPRLDERRLGRLERALWDALVEARASGLIGREPDAFRVRCLAGAFAAAASDSPRGVAIEEDERAEILLDFSLRAFR
ncbi:MAG TPA: TetR family transcriptional regulator [Polyangiaceae bacterium]|nr:TetR family transcriptional regulator [Polyangiaceae bacterium]